jgi:hypothetical protein
MVNTRIAERLIEGRRISYVSFGSHPPLFLSLFVSTGPGSIPSSTPPWRSLFSAAVKIWSGPQKKEWHQATRKQISRSGMGKWGWGIGGVWKWVSGVKSYDSKQAWYSFLSIGSIGNN